MPEEHRRGKADGREIENEEDDVRPRGLDPWQQHQGHNNERNEAERGDEQDVPEESPRRGSHAVRADELHKPIQDGRGDDEPGHPLVEVLEHCPVIDLPREGAHDDRAEDAAGTTHSRDNGQDTEPQDLRDSAPGYDHDERGGEPGGGIADEWRHRHLVCRVGSRPIRSYRSSLARARRVA